MVKLQETKFKVGDQVKVVNYGHLLWCNKKFDGHPTSYPVFSENADFVVLDTAVYLIGEIGIITEANKTQGIDGYILKGPNKTAWYSNDQLELIYRPEYASI